MRCPKCDTYILVTHTYRAGKEAHTNRRECPKCGMTFTTVTMVIAVEPERGEGANSVCIRLRNESSEIQKIVRDRLMPNKHAL